MVIATVNISDPSARWLNRVARHGQPVYLALVKALDEAIRDGELQAGDRLPPQRTVGDLLGINFTTVTRAYEAARSRGLLEGAVGRGTYVRARTSDDEAGLVDLSMNLPPPPDGVSLAALLKDTTRDVLDRTDTAALMAYHPGAGTLGQKTAAASWLAPSLGEVNPERLLICPGAQTALAAILATVARAGAAVIVEPLTYPGLRAAATRLGLRLVACPVDGEGMLPDALDRLCAEEGPAAVYIVPTLQNPTATTMGAQRRRDLAGVIRARRVWLIEDDPYSRLIDDPPPAVATFAPERSIYVATLSKCLSPGLRTAFVATPEGPIGADIAAGLRAIGLMASPLMTAVVASWIRDGAAEQLLAGVRREARARRRIAAELLPTAVGSPEAIHVWQGLPQGWRPDRLSLVAQQRGLSLVTAEAFAVDDVHPNGLRISLGGPRIQAVLREALRKIANLLEIVPVHRQTI